MSSSKMQFYIWLKKILATVVCLIFSFQTASAELNIDKVFFSSWFGKKHFSFETKFKFDSKNSHDLKLPYFRIMLEGETEKGRLHVLTLDEKNFFIPADLSSTGESPGIFYLTPWNIRHGFFRKLYNYLSDENRERLEVACSYLNNESVIREMIEFALQWYPEKETFLIENNISESALNLTKLCEENSKKVYIEDVQASLVALGYMPGPIDGNWGNKTRTALNMLFQDKGLEWKQKLTANVFRELRIPLGLEGERLIGKGYNAQYFDYQGNLRNVPVNMSVKLRSRKTINVCRPWNPRYGIKKYGIAWTANPLFSNKTITLNSVNWNYHYPEMQWDNYRGIERFLTNKNWDHGAEYGKTLATRIVDPDFPTFIAEVIRVKVKDSQSDGVMLDWWHNDHNSGYSKSQVSNARKNIANAIRKEIGSKGIILGNVNWRKDKDTVGLINGVFLELGKKNSRAFNSSELSNIQDILQFYDENLKPPKLICLEGQRKTKDLSDVDRNTPENRKMAKLLTAMSVVIPESGYILYADNNSDTPDGDHAHLYYDFYSFDIGRPTSRYIEVSWGVGYKEHQQGFIAYNINSSQKILTRSNGQTFNIPGKSGLFCEDKNSKTKCLPID